FLIRLAGPPFDTVEQLATPETCSLAREVSQTDIEATKKTELARTIETELGSVRAKLWNTARTILAPYLVFAGGGVRELLAHLLDKTWSENLQRRNSRAGDRERHLLLYVQRVAAKNDTFSEFGPSSWGKTNPKIAGVA